MIVTPHFLVAEFDQPARHGQRHVPYPADWVEDRLRPLCEQLEILREYCGGRPVHILSGFRTPIYNGIVGGRSRSFHLVGRAADVIIDDLTARDVFEAVQHLLTVGKLPLIRGVGSYTHFTHVDTRDSDQVVHWFGQRTAV